MNKLKTIVYAGSLACALCFGKSVDSIVSHHTPLVDQVATKRVELFVSCWDRNAPGPLIARGMSSKYEDKSRARFERESSSIVDEIKKIESDPDYERQVKESNSGALECWGYQLLGLMLAGIGGVYLIKSKIKERQDSLENKI